MYELAIILKQKPLPVCTPALLTEVHFNVKLFRGLKTEVLNCN